MSRHARNYYHSCITSALRRSPSRCEGFELFFSDQGAFGDPPGEAKSLSPRPLTWPLARCIRPRGPKDGAAWEFQREKIKMR